MRTRGVPSFKPGQNRGNCDPRGFPAYPPQVSITQKRDTEAPSEGLYLLLFSPRSSEWLLTLSAHPEVQIELGAIENGMPSNVKAYRNLLQSFANR
jgi:hypothetical protein